MKRLMRIVRTLPMALAALLLAAAAPAIWADEETEFEEAEIFFELNNTDGDLGIHALIDGDAWKLLRIVNPGERELLNVRLKSRLRRQGLTELFFESAEPTFDELPPWKFFSRFPEGEYEIVGRTLDGEQIESEAELTHLMPAPPVPTVNGEPMAQVCDEDDPDYDAPEVTGPVTIEWAEVTTSHPDLGSPRSSTDIVIHNYEVAVEAEVEVGGGEELEVIFSVILPPGETSVTIPEEFLALGEEFKYEVLVREESFNQTATESCFILAE